MKEENQRDCAVHINLNQIAEARKKKKKFCSKEENQRDCVGIYEKRNYWNHNFTWFLIFNPLHGKSTATFLNHFPLQKTKILESGTTTWF